MIKYSVTPGRKLRTGQSLRWPGHAATLAAALALAVAPGCTASPGSFAARLTENGRLLADGPPARMTAAAIEQSRAETVPLLYDFAVQAGQINSGLSSGVDAQQTALLARGIDWRAVTLVGEGYVDAQCDRFLSALDELERSKRGTLADLNTLQSATVGIMGLAVAAQKAIGIVGIAFGLVANLIDQSTSVVLYQLPAASIRTIVRAQRDTLRLNEQEPGGAVSMVGNQGLAAARLAEYVQYCVPVSIEANVAKVLNNTYANIDGRIGSQPVTPVVTSALIPTISAIPAGTPVTHIRPAVPVVGRVVDVGTQRRKVALFAAIRALTDPQAILRAAAALGLPGGPDGDATQLRNRLIVEINSQVQSGDPMRDKQQLDLISGLLEPVLRHSF